METISASLSTMMDLMAPPEPHQVTALVILWSRDEPERVGEVAIVPTSAPGTSVLLGRAAPALEDGLLRVGFVRQRPGRIDTTGALRSPRISREQLRLEFAENRSLRVENVGRCPLTVNGKPVTVATLHPGDLLELHHQLVLYCAQRPVGLPTWAPGTPAPAPHAFGEPDAHGIVGESPTVWSLRERIAFVADRGAHVLIRGASGTGKELVAQAIHALSSRGSRPMVSRNAATFPETLIDAELFGNARNYPNPGMPERPGLVGEADGSSLFLDEFGELPAGMQAHLLRVLDRGEYQRLGESRTRRADFRLIAATNRPDSYLKEDVLARLRIRIELPDLNARREDIPILTRHMLRRIALTDRAIATRYFPDGNPKGEPRTTPALISALVQRTWTTHVRELESLLWDAMLNSRADYLDVFDGIDQPAEPEEPVRDPATGSLVDPMSLTAEQVQEVLDKHGGKQEPAWRELGFSSRHVLTRLVRRYNLRVRGRNTEGE